MKIEICKNFTRDRKKDNVQMYYIGVAGLNLIFYTIGV